MVVVGLAVFPGCRCQYSPAVVGCRERCLWGQAWATVKVHSELVMVAVAVVPHEGCCIGGVLASWVAKLACRPRATSIDVDRKVDLRPRLETYGAGWFGPPTRLMQALHKSDMPVSKAPAQHCCCGTTCRSKGLYLCGSNNARPEKQQEQSNNKQQAPTKQPPAAARCQQQQQQQGASSLVFTTTTRSLQPGNL